MVAGQIINCRLTLLFDFSGGLVRIEHVWRQRNIVACVGEEALIGHVVIVEAGNREGGGKALHRVVVVILFRVGIFVFVERVAPLPAPPQGQVRFGVGLNRDAVVFLVDERGSIG
jgi:hypothetical protein